MTGIDAHAVRLPLGQLGQPLLQEAPAPVEARHHRPDRDPEDLGGIGVGELADVHEHHDLAEVLGDLAERLDDAASRQAREHALLRLAAAVSARRL